MSWSVNIVQLNENCGNNHEQKTEKLELICYYNGAQ